MYGDFGGQDIYLENDVMFLHAGVTDSITHVSLYHFFSTTITVSKIFFIGKQYFYFILDLILINCGRIFSV